MPTGKLRKVLFWIAGISAFFIVALFAAQRLLGPEVKKLFITEINKSLSAQVEVGDVSLSLFKDFPFASVRFNGVRMKEALPKPSKLYLLKAETISLRFNILDLLRGNYKVKVLRLSDVEVNAKVYLDGSDNFHFWKPAQNSGNDNLNFELQRIIMHNIHVIYTNEPSQTLIDAHLPGFVANGKFGTDTYGLNLAGNIVIHQFKMQSTEYSGERELNVWLAMEANSSSGEYKITEGRIETGKLQLKADGNITYSQVRKNMNLTISAVGSTLEEMISLVPAKFAANLKDYTFKGKADINSTITGLFGENHLPAVNVSLVLQNGTISEKSSGVSLREVYATAAYSIKNEGRSETITISNLKAKLGDGFINGSLVMNGLKSPRLQCSINASANLNELQQFLKSDYFNSMSGWMKLNAAFDGLISDIKHPSAADFRNSNFSGSGSIQQGNIVLKDYGLPLQGVNTQFTFNGNDLQLQQLILQIGKSNFNLKGTLNNMMSWMLTEGENLGVNGLLVSQRFDWDEISSAQQSSGKEYIFSLPGTIDVGQLQFRCADFKFSTFSATNVLGSIQMHDKVLVVNGISMLTSQGKVTGQVTINAMAKEHALLQAKAHLDKVNVQTLFKQFGNFGQSDLVAENLEGMLTSDIVFAALMHSNLDIDLNSVKVHADLLIDNGRLVNYQPMQSLSKFLRVEDLADIRFQSLQNQIDIANQVIFIPSMQVKSSALDLELMGTHTFDNELDYHFVIALADLLAAKYKRKNTIIDTQSEFGQIEDDGRGKTKIFVSLSGTVENPVVKYDKKAVRQKITNELQKQKVELKQILKQEFNWFSSDSLKKSQKIKEKELQKKQEEGKFVIEWDDDKK